MRARAIAVSSLVALSALLGTAADARADGATHAPEFSLWAGPRVSFTGFGFTWYRFADGSNETTGDLVRNGVGTELDLGVRVARRFIPYVFYEHSFLGAGRRFDGDDSASASSDYYGLGFRFLSGDVDFLSFCTDLSIGKRVVSVRNGTGTFSMSGLEVFRLGLGAEVRPSTRFTVEPMFAISGGTLDDTSGSITWADRGDGKVSPPYQHGDPLASSRPYVMFSFGLGAHVDLFGQ